MAKDSVLAESASTWMQVVFGGLGLSVAIVGAVIAYFAWVQPHSSSDGEPSGAKPAGPAAALSGSATADGAVKAVPLGNVEASIGGALADRSCVPTPMRGKVTDIRGSATKAPRHESAGRRYPVDTSKPNSDLPEWVSGGRGSAMITSRY